MKAERLVRTLEDGKRVLYTSIHCDECPTLHTYEGNDSRDSVRIQLRLAGWTFGHTGIIRCRPCALKQSIAINNAFR